MPLLYSSDSPPPMHIFCKPKRTCIFSTASPFLHHTLDIRTQNPCRVVRFCFWDCESLLSRSSPQYLCFLDSKGAGLVTCRFDQIFNRHKLLEQRVPLTSSFRRVSDHCGREDVVAEVAHFMGSGASYMTEDRSREPRPETGMNFKNCS